MPLSRREFLRSGAALAAATALPRCASRSPDARRGAPAFRHGVASGDPLAGRVILWTRVTPGDAGGQHEVAYTIARDPALADVVARGSLTTGPHRDYTVKLDAGGLEPATTYYYRFATHQARSPIGRTRTLPSGAVERLRLAVCSCANYPEGYFNAYARVAERADLAAVLHLGDYLYEYGRDGFGGDAGLGRDVDPAHEIVSLADYRTRYAQYRSDPDLQEAHRQHPFIAIWDDHESANNAWRGGAQNHQPDSEGTWAARLAAAVQAYEEWMPIRPVHTDLWPGRIYRAFRFGDLVDLMMLDTRLVGRDEQAARDDLAAMADPERRLLGAAQAAWLETQLSESQRDGTRWRVIGQQGPLAPLALPGRPRNSDIWDGYEAARLRLLEHVEGAGIENLVVLTGDYHSSWAMEVGRDPFAGGSPPLAVEFVAPALTATPLGSIPGARESMADVPSTHPHVRYLDIDQRGYLLVDVDRQRCQAEWWFPDRIRTRGGAESLGAAWATWAGEARLLPARGASSAAPAPELAPPLENDPT